MKLNFTDGIINTLGFGAACCAALTATGGTLAIAGGLMSMGAAGISLKKCVSKSQSAQFDKHMKAAQKHMEDGLRLDARIKGDFTQDDIDRTFSELKQALPKFKTDLLLADFARWNLRPSRIAIGLTEKISHPDVSPFFASSPAGRDIAEALIEQAFMALKQEDSFWKNIEIYVHEEILIRLDNIKDHVTTEADRIIADLTEKLKLVGTEKLSFESAVRHILESTNARDAATQEALKQRDIPTALSIRMSRLMQEDAMMDDLNRAKAQEWRDTGALAAPISVAKTITAYEQAIKYDPTQVWDYIYLSRAYVKHGNLPAAYTIIEMAKTLKIFASRYIEPIIYSDLGHISFIQGAFTASRNYYQDSYNITKDNILKELVVEGVNNPAWQRKLSILNMRFGDISVAQNDLTAAHTSYQNALEITQRLAAQDPDNACLLYTSPSPRDRG